MFVAVNFCAPLIDVLYMSCSYYVLGKISRTPSFGRQTSNQENSLTAVVYGMVQVRKKQALGSSLSVPSPKQLRNAPTATLGPGRGLSVSFSLRKKSKRASNQKLHRMHSENPKRLGQNLGRDSMLDLGMRRATHQSFPDDIHKAESSGSATEFSISATNRTD